MISGYVHIVVPHGLHEEGLVTMLDLNESNHSSTMKIVSEKPSTDLCCTISYHPPRRVSFAEHLDIKEVPRRMDLPAGELRARWLNEEDYAGVLLEGEVTEAVLKCADKIHLVDDELLCARGLHEYETISARAESSSFIQKLVVSQHALLTHQRDYDPSLVARVYHDCAKAAVRKALEDGTQDEEDAQRYYQEFLATSDEDVLLSIVAQASLMGSNDHERFLASERKLSPASLPDNQKRARIL
jgi:hypothetical protein